MVLCTNSCRSRLARCQRQIGCVSGMRRSVENALVGYRDLSAGSFSCRGQPWLGRHRVLVHPCLLQMRIVLSCQAVPRVPRTCRQPHPLCSVQQLVNGLLQIVRGCLREGGYGQPWTGLRAVESDGCFRNALSILLYRSAVALLSGVGNRG